MQARLGDYLLEFLTDYVSEDDLQAVAQGIIELLEESKISMEECYDIFEAAEGSYIEFELDEGE